MVIQGYLPLLTREEHIVRLLDEAWRRGFGCGPRVTDAR